jgi:hypothetical protein
MRLRALLMTPRGQGLISLLLRTDYACCMAEGFTGDLQLEESMPFHKREWFIKRVGWVIFLLILVAALAGLLGPGPLSKRIVKQEAAGLTIEYERFLRSHREAELKILVHDAGSEELKIALGRELSRRSNIRSIVPEPESATSGEDQLLFKIKANGKNGEIKIEFEPTHMGNLAFDVNQEGKPPIQIRMFVYP